MEKCLFFAIVFSVLTACGPSAAEIAERERIKSDSLASLAQREMVKADSIAQAAREELLRQQEYAKEQESLRSLLIDLKAQLAGEEARLQSIEGFQLLRTRDEKAQQISDQVKIIEEIRVQIEEIQRQISQ